MTILSLRVPIRFLRGSAFRLILTILAVACAVALVCAVDLTNRAVLQTFIEIVDTMAGRAALQVVAGPAGLFDEEIATRLATVPGVEAAVPAVSAWAFTTDGAGDQLAVHGVDLTDERSVRLYEPAGDDRLHVEDPLVLLSRPDSVLVTEEFARRKNLRIDDQLSVRTPSGLQRFTVRGLLAPRGVARVQGGNLLVMDIAAAEHAFTQDRMVNRIDIVVRRDADVQSVAEAIMAAVPPGLRVERPAQRKMDLHRMMRSIQVLLRSVGLFGLVAAFLIAFSRLSTVFEARAWQLAMLRAGGVRVRRVWWELTKESLVVGSAGVLIGIPLGVELARVLLPMVATTTAISAKLIASEAHLELSWLAMISAAGLGLFAVLCAAAIPAWRAARVSVAEVLRRRDEEQRQGDSTSWRLVVVAAAVVTLFIHAWDGSVPSGLVASALVILSAAIAARPLLSIVSGPLERVAAFAFGPTGRHAASNLRRNPGRSAVAVATLGVGFGSVLWLSTLAASFERSVISVMPGVLRGDLAVSASDIGAGYVEAPVRDSLVQALLDVPGVDAAVGEQAVDWEYAAGPIAINAFDARYFTDDRFGSWPLLGRRLPDAGGLVGRGDAVIVSENFIRNIGVGVGDIVKLDTPRGTLDVRVAAVTPDFLSPRGTIEMSRELYKHWWQDNHVMRVLVRAGSGVDVDALRGTIAARLGDQYGLRILSLDRLIGWFSEQVRRAFSGLHVIAGLVLVVVLVGIGDAVAAGMLERTRELGIARALGVPRRSVGRAVMLEALMLGTLGVALAWLVGLALGTLWVECTFPALLGWTLTLHLPAEECVGIGLAVLGVCVIAAYLPARHAARLDPVAALKAE